MTTTTPQGADTKSSYPLVTALTAVRKSRQITQAELAQRAGLSRMTVQRLESNGLDPRLSTLQEMARVLGYELVAIPTDLKPAFTAWMDQQLPGRR
ncbi:MAG: helix-turn-helix domain-containing protein [Comamonas sp.]